MGPRSAVFSGHLKELQLPDGLVPALFPQANFRDFYISPSEEVHTLNEMIEK